MVDIKLGERATKVEKNSKDFFITTSKGNYDARAIWSLQAGSRRKTYRAGRNGV